ncbi:MAG: methyltransferase domain-containing protein [Bacteroidetes bacterium]|nr:methyltransferase domain-containing protein [Bacteroidota bacterium]
MDKQYEELYHSEEEKNWWFIARRDMLFKFFDKYKVPKHARILDIGCAGATFLMRLKEMGYTNLYALDYSAEAIEEAKKKGIDNAYVMDGHCPKFPENSFDVIVSSDSIEHLKDDELALKNWLPILKPGGLGIILAPAYNFLWTAHDDVNYHYRRYTKADLSTKARNAGFKTIFSGYNNVLLFIPTAIVRLTMRLFTPKTKTPGVEGQILNLPDWAHKFLAGFQKMENTWCKYISFPFGVSAFVVVRKP